MVHLPHSHSVSGEALKKYPGSGRGSHLVRVRVRLRDKDNKVQLGSRIRVRF